MLCTTSSTTQYAASPGAAYCGVLGLYIAAVLCLPLIRGRTRPTVQAGSRLELVRAGLAYVYQNKI